MEKTKLLNIDKVTLIAPIFELEPLQLLCFDEQHLFNEKIALNPIEKGTIGLGIQRECEHYEKRIENLQSEISFLREQLKSTLKL